MYYKLKFENAGEAKSMTRFINILLKRKDSSSYQNTIEVDTEEKDSSNFDNPLDYLTEYPNNASILEEWSVGPTIVGAHIELVKGVICRNSPIKVLCPILAKGIICSRGTGPAMSGTPYRPKLLVKNHENPNIQLWSCKGCPDFLIKVNIDENSLAD